MNLGKSLNSGNLRAWLSLLLHLGGTAVKSSRGHSLGGTSATPGQDPVLWECTCWVSVRTQGWRKYFYIFYDSVSDSRLPFLWATYPQQKIIFIWGREGAVIRGVFLVTFHTCDCSCLFDLFQVWRLFQPSLPHQPCGGLLWGDPLPIFQVNHICLWHLRAYEVGQQAWCRFQCFSDLPRAFLSFFSL